MAIEFNCPYCTATIRVPDQFSGKRGSCPKCATRLLVPDIAPPASTAKPAAPISPNPETGVPRVGGDSAAGGDSAVGGDSAAGGHPLAAGGGPPALPDAFSAPLVPGVPPFVPTNSGSSLSKTLRRKERRQKSRRVYSIGVPVLCFVAFFGLMAALFLVRTPELKGTLRGSVSQGMQIPQATFPLSGLTLTDEERRLATDAFSKEAESFISPRMTCRISAAGPNLAVDVSAGDGFVWLAVNPSGDINLMSWIRDNTAALNQARLAKIAAVGADLCRDKIRKASGSAVVFDAEQYRDGFGLNVHLNAFGFAVEGIVDRQLTPCAHADANGTLYFAVPSDAKSLTLRGRRVFGGKSLFPGEYSVPIVPTAATQPASDSAPPAETMSEDDDTADGGDNSMDADAPNSKMSPPDSAPPSMQPGVSPN